MDDDDDDGLVQKYLIWFFELIENNFFQMKQARVREATKSKHRWRKKEKRLFTFV